MHDRHCSLAHRRNSVVARLISISVIARLVGAIGRAIVGACRGRARDGGTRRQSDAGADQRAHAGLRCCHRPERQRAGQGPAPERASSCFSFAVSFSCAGSINLSRTPHGAAGSMRQRRLNSVVPGEHEAPNARRVNFEHDGVTNGTKVGGLRIGRAAEQQRNFFCIEFAVVPKVPHRRAARWMRANSSATRGAVCFKAAAAASRARSSAATRAVVSPAGSSRIAATSSAVRATPGKPCASCQSSSSVSRAASAIAPEHP